MLFQKQNDVNILDLIDDKPKDQISTMLAEYHPADIADIINHAPAKTYRYLFSLVTDEFKPDVLIDLEAEAKADILESLNDQEISKILERMPPDDATDLLGHLPDEQTGKVLDLMKAADSKDVRLLLKYGSDTAGGIMTTEVVAMHENQTVGEAVDAIAYFDTHEQFYNVNIVDAAGKLIGYIDVWELLREKNKARPLRELANTDFNAARADMDQEEVARLISKYDLTVIPVVNASGKLVGRITADDVIDVMEEEASEDIFRLAGSDNAELDTVSPLKSCIVRLPWLFITLMGGFATSLILTKFLSHVAEILILAAFVPIVLAMGGNTGIQSSTLIVRGLAVGTLKGRSVSRMMLRELLTGAIMGGVCSIVIGIWAHFMVSGSTGYSPLLLASIVGLALFTAMTFAAVFGALVPIMLSRTRIDPAVASGPFVTISNDILALLIYFGVTILLLHKFS